MTESLTPAGDPAWTVVGSGAPAPAFQNSWVDNGAAGEPPTRFRKLSSGLVVLEGRIKSGTTHTTAFALPAGYRPSGTIFFVGLASGDLAYLSVGSDGTVVPNDLGTSAVNTYVSLSAIAFFADQ